MSPLTPSPTGGTSHDHIERTELVVLTISGHERRDGGGWCVHSEIESDGKLTPTDVAEVLANCAEALLTEPIEVHPIGPAGLSQP